MGTFFSVGALSPADAATHVSVSASMSSPILPVPGPRVVCVDSSPYDPSSACRRGWFAATASLPRCGNRCAPAATAAPPAPALTVDVAAPSPPGPSAGPPADPPAPSAVLTRPSTRLRYLISASLRSWSAIRLPLRQDRRPTRATISWRVVALSVTGLPVRRTSASAGKSFSTSTDSHSCTALSASNKPVRVAKGMRAGAPPSAAVARCTGYATRVSLFPPRWSRSRRGRNARRSTSPHSSSALSSRFSARSPVSATAVAALTSPSPSPRQAIPHPPMLSSSSDGRCAASDAT
mmetsp:Transcript_27195/g.68053  ORF Transcript_27195/g.68053 Transcript_27195/m.68053 type:complete len:293 (+) Transcript_27195:279-1157(+)